MTANEYITVKDYFKKMKRNGYEPDQVVILNAIELLRKVNKMINFLYSSGYLDQQKDKIEVTSGWRTEEYNKKIGGAKKSNHITGHAIDIKGREIILALEENESILQIFNLYAESSLSTVIKKQAPWTHLQDLPPNSRRRIFAG